MFEHERIALLAVVQFQKLQGIDFGKNNLESILYEQIILAGYDPKHQAVIELANKVKQVLHNRRRDWNERRKVIHWPMVS